MTHPIVSVIIANYNAADYLEAALESVMAQSVSQIEILVIDDASTDASVAIARAMAEHDNRLQVIETSANAGPAAARNRGLDLAAGNWIAIVDSDDLIHPQRFELMIEAATSLRTDAIADDLTYFTENGLQSGETLMGDGHPSAPVRLTPKRLMSADPDAPQLGYLKPLIRRAALGDLRYREDIRIGEDHEFYMRFMLNDGRLHVLPQSYYLYRRHAGSLSHRMHPQDVRAMIAVQDDLLIQYPDLSAELRAEFAARRIALQEPLAFETLAMHLKTRQFGLALQDVMRKPVVLWKFASVAKTRLMRYLKSTKHHATSFPDDPGQWSAQDWATLANQRSDDV